jgi:uncharacterized protein YjiS (DUF1127 family)
MTLITISRPLSLSEIYRRQARELRKSWGSQFSEWRGRVRMRRELLALCDSDLRDIRWTRAEVEAEGRKPFWQA